MPANERIIVIDDNANDLQVIRRVLERSGYVVSTAGSGEEGIELASRIAPDTFIVDYRMPGMDGFEVARRIKRDLQLARRVQEALVPSGAFRGPRIEIRSAYIPSETLSGDFYDYFLHDNLM